MMIREKKYDFIRFEQREFTEVFLEKKREKKTFLEQAYLRFFGEKEFDRAYFSVSGSRKVFFMHESVMALVQAYDEAEMEFAKNSEHPERRDEFFAFMENFVVVLKEVLDSFFVDLVQRRDPRRLGFYAGNFFAEEVRKLIAIIMDSETDAGNFFMFKMMEDLASYRRKIAFKLYEKYVKKLFKAREVSTANLQGFARSYLNVAGKLKSGQKVRMYKAIGQNLRKFDEDQLVLIEGLFR